jgi:hypothetical protein
MRITTFKEKRMEKSNISSQQTLNQMNAQNLE